MAERRTLEAETAPMVEPAEVVVAMRVEPDDAVTSGGPPEAVPVVAVVTEPPVVQASLVRSLSTMRPVVHTTGAAGSLGVPFCTCRCDGLKDGLEKPAMALCAALSYLCIGAIIVVGAGGIARLTAATDLYGVGLGFVAWLLCFTLFTGCAVCWWKAAGGGDADDLIEDMDQPGNRCFAVWCSLGVLASVLCIVLSHVGNRIHYMESAKPGVEGVDPRATEVRWGEERPENGLSFPPLFH